MTQEETILGKHLIDLANRSYQRNINTCTNFLNLAEVEVLHRNRKEYQGVSFETFGGKEGAERVVACFYPESENHGSLEYPIVALKMEPLNAKFAEELSHRDVLGAVLNLGIEREMIGDIEVNRKEAVLYCIASIAAFIEAELTRIRHTTVKCTRIPLQALQEGKEKEYESLDIAIASERVDAICAALTKQSRSQVLELFRTGRIFVNSRVCESNSAALRAGDILTIRGNGKFRYEGINYTGRKGKLHAIVLKYC